jgi:hypothetical protein
MKLLARALLVPIALIFLASGSARAQQDCGAEVKVLLDPGQLQKALSSLKAKGETPGHNYFYDTPELQLLSQGLILRLRDKDLTVKLRPSSDKKFRGSSGDGERFKCEGEIVGGVENNSFSVAAPFTADRVPETGEQLQAVLSPGQKKLLEDSGIAIDWSRVKQVANIQSTSWKVRGNAQEKLSLELWQWPKGSVLELSTKAGADAGRPSYDALEDLAKAKGLQLSADQRSKTATALHSINGVPAQ